MRNIFNYSDSKEKQPGHKEAGEGLSQVIKGTSDALFNILAAGGTLTLAGASKISEKLGSNDEKIVASKKEITSHRLDQSKKSIKKVGEGVIDILKGGIKAVKGAGRTLLKSGKDTINGLKNDDKLNKDKKVN